MRRHLPVLLTAAALLVGCGSRTYKATDARLGSTKVAATVKLKDRLLTTSTRAGDFPVRAVRVRLLDGTIVEPSVMVQQPSRRKGGWPLGVGVGTGTGHVGVGVGTGVRVGGRTVPGPVDARFIDIDTAGQPFELLVEIDSKPAIEVPVMLGKRVAPEHRPTSPLDIAPDGWIETWKLPDGSTTQVRATRAKEGAYRIEPITSRGDGPADEP